MKQSLLLLFIFVTFGGLFMQPKIVLAAPVCNAFTATPNVLGAPGDITLAWDISDASSAEINNGIGVIGNIVDGVTDFTGSVVFSVSTNTVFIVDVTDYVDDIICTVSVTIVPPMPPTCDLFTATPNSFIGSGTTTLSWDIGNVQAITIDDGLDSVVVSVADPGDSVIADSIDLFVSTNTTFGLTATNLAGSTVCDTAVSVTALPPTPTPTTRRGSSATRVPEPQCVFFDASTEEAVIGDLVTLSFETKNTDLVTIYEGKVSDNKIVYEVKPGTSKAGAVAVTVTDATTYTLVAETGRRSDECSTTVLLRDSFMFGGAGFGQNEGAILLTEVPETGYQISLVSKMMLYVLLATGTLFVLFMGLHISRLGVFATQSTVTYGRFTPISAAADHALRVHKTRSVLIIVGLIVLVVMLVVELI